MKLESIYASPTRAVKPAGARPASAAEQGPFEAFNQVFQSASRRTESRSDQPVREQSSELSGQAGQQDIEQAPQESIDQAPADPAAASTDPSVAQAAADPQPTPDSSPTDEASPGAETTVEQADSPVPSEIAAAFTAELSAQQDQAAIQLHTAAEVESAQVKPAAKPAPKPAALPLEAVKFQRPEPAPKSPQPEDVVKELQTAATPVQLADDSVAVESAPKPVIAVPAAKTPAAIEPALASPRAQTAPAPTPEAAVPVQTRVAAAPQTGDSGADPHPDSASSQSKPRKPTAGVSHEARIQATAAATEAAASGPTTATPATGTPILESLVTVDPSTISDSGSSGPAQPAEAPRSAAPQAPAPTPAPRQELSEADQQRLAEQALRGLKSVVNQRGGSLTLRLNPPDLGELRIRVELSPHAIRAQFEASSPQVASMLQRQMDTLRTALESQGLRVDHLQAQSPTAPAPTWQGAGEQAAGEDGQSKGMYQQQGGDQDAHSRRQDERDSPGKFERELLNLVA